MPFATDNVSAVQVNILSEARESGAEAASTKIVLSLVRASWKFSLAFPRFHGNGKHENPRSRRRVGATRFSQHFSRCSLSVATSRSSFSNAFSFFSRFYPSLSIEEKKVSFFLFWFGSGVSDEWKVLAVKWGKKPRSGLEKRRRPHTHSAFHLITRRIPLRWALNERLRITLKSSFGSSSIFSAFPSFALFSSPCSSAKTQEYREKNVKGKEKSKWSEVLCRCCCHK